MPEQRIMTLAERVLRDHLAGGRFRLGAVKERWRLVDFAWPNAYIAVTAAPRENAPAEYCFRFDCSGYPQSAPTAAPWDLTENAPLPSARWPGGTGRVASAFNPSWKNGYALYLPCDRQSIEGHHDWASKHPHLIWNPQKQITDYLGVIHDYLASPLYTGVRGS